MKSFHGRTQSACGAHMFLISVNGELWGNDEVMLVHWTGSNKRLVLSKWSHSYWSTDTHTHTCRNETGSQRLSGQEKIKLRFQFVFIFTRGWITDTPKSSLYVSDLRNILSQTVGFFPDMKKEKQKEAWSSAIFMRSFASRERETSRHTHRERLKTGLRTQILVLKKKCATSI